MAKAQKDSEKKSPTSKTAKEGAKKTTSKSSSEPPKKAAPRAAQPKALQDAPRREGPEDIPKAVHSFARPNPDASQVRAHPDAKLTKAEVGVLFQKLVEEKNRVLSNFERHVDDALSDEDILADEIDIAQRSTDQAWLFRMADKDRKLLIEIDAALEKMRSGEYGICEGTDEPIGFKRLELRPWTRYSVAYKEMLEREKAQQAR